MITFKNAPKKYKSKNGDIFWGATEDWALQYKDEDCPFNDIVDKIRPLNKGENKDRPYVPLFLVDSNPLLVLKELDIDIGPFEDCRYKDVITSFHPYSIFPNALFSENSRCDDILKRRWYGADPGIKNDAFWKESIMYTKSPLIPNNLITHFMGTGYTPSCRPMDGSGSIESAVIDLDNGDSLHVLFWNWYNK